MDRGWPISKYDGLTRIELEDRLEKAEGVVTAARAMTTYANAVINRKRQPNFGLEAELATKLDESLAALNGLVVVGEDGDDVSLHRPEADGGVADDGASHLRNPSARGDGVEPRPERK